LRLFDPEWSHRIDQHAGKQLGNKERHRDIQTKEATDAKDVATRRNNQFLYKLYRGFHHAKAGELLISSTRQILNQRA
jgi:hypothetical protein